MQDVAYCLAAIMFMLLLVEILSVYFDSFQISQASLEIVCLLFTENFIQET